MQITFGLIFAFIIYQMIPPIPLFFLLLVTALPIWWFAITIVNIFWPPIFVVAVVIIILVSLVIGWKLGGSGKTP